MSTLKLVKGSYPGASFDDLICSSAEYNQMLGKSHKILYRNKRSMSLACSAGHKSCDFRANAVQLKKRKSMGSGEEMGGVEGIRITNFVHHSCTVGCQRSRQLNSKVLTGLVTSLQDYVPGQGPAGEGAMRLMQEHVKRASGIDINRGQAQNLIKKRTKEIKEATGVAPPLTQRERVEQATNKLLNNFIRQLGHKDADGTYAVMANTGNRRKAAKAAAELFFHMAGDDLAELVVDRVGNNNAVNINHNVTTGGGVAVSDSDIATNNCEVSNGVPGSTLSNITPGIEIGNTVSRDGH